MTMTMLAGPSILRSIIEEEEVVVVVDKEPLALL
jgi:hypothetical protein